MRKATPIRLLRALAAAFAFLLVSSCGGGESLTVSAAASLSDALGEIAAEFERANGVEVSLNLGGSNALATHVELGAPADVVIFAGDAPMNRLASNGRIRPESRIVVLRNRLVVVAKTGANVPASSFEELLLSAPGRIAIADPDLAPAGAYAAAAIDAAGLAAGLDGRLIPALDVRAAAAAVQSGSARLGIVYATDALAFDGLETVAEIPSGLHPPINYPAAITATTEFPAVAAEFLRFLRSDFATTVFTSAGFARAP